MSLVSVFKNLGSRSPMFYSMLLFGAISVLYTDILVRQLADEERKFITIWAQALAEVSKLQMQGEVPQTIYELVEKNTTIPVILVDDQGMISGARNFSESVMNDNELLINELAGMDMKSRPITIELEDGKKNYVYYKESRLITLLFYYPLVQVSVVLLMLSLTYFAISSSRRAEQNQVWVGMSKETAHQLGTPIQSLVAWVELMKAEDGHDSKLMLEVEKDVQRLQTIAERFSKIGSIPNLQANLISAVLENAIEYLRTRSPKKVSYNLVMNDVSRETTIPINVSLFEWVVENICKNAIDAMNGQGRIIISLTRIDNENLAIDISDTGKGMVKGMHKKIFRPGFTTKKRGWGLGLSLTKRIVEEYHDGKIFVKISVPSRGTTFRILMPAKYPTGNIL
jgi:K+-sensing histidine kinase KdpD